MECFQLAKHLLRHTLSYTLDHGGYPELQLKQSEPGVVLQNTQESSMQVGRVQPLVTLKEPLKFFCSPLWSQSTWGGLVY